MGREVRKVPAGWEHPKDEAGRYVPLFEGCFKTDAEEWDKGCAKWNKGEFPEYANETGKKMSYEEWSGSRPSEVDYMPEWDADTATLLMMYENTSEGSPISPAFETPEELAQWLFDNEASAFGGQTASYEGWLRVANGGYACSAVVRHGQGMVSGVDAL